MTGTLRRIGVIMNGVTGRMGLNQHLVRSIMAIRAQGGVTLPGGERLFPEPVLVGRDESKLQDLARAHGIARVSTDLEACLDDPVDAMYFDATTTALRADHVGRAIARVVDSGFFGRIVSVRGEFGYWVFEGDWGPPAQRPSWNYRKEDGGGIIVDMFAHWRYLLDHTFGAVKAVQCTGATHVPERVDERGRRYRATADDAAYATFLLDAGGNEVIAQFNSSWATRVYRDDLLHIQVDGTLGSAVAGLRDCKTQRRADTPRPVWDPDAPNPFDFPSQWQEVADPGECENAFKTQWELFLRHVAAGTPFPHDFQDGAKGVQLAELAHQSWAERRWVEVPPLDAPPSLPARTQDAGHHSAPAR